MRKWWCEKQGVAMVRLSCRARHSLLMAATAATLESLLSCRTARVCAAFTDGGRRAFEGSPIVGLTVAEASMPCRNVSFFCVPRSSNINSIGSQGQSGVLTNSRRSYSKRRTTVARINNNRNDETTPAGTSSGKQSKTGELVPKKKRKETNVAKSKKTKDLMRADRILSNRGVGSRTETFKLLQARRVAYLPNNSTSSDLSSPLTQIPVKGPSEKIPWDAILFLDGKKLPGVPPILIAFHKPKFVLSAMHDSKQRPHLGNFLPRRYLQAGMHPVGRLDYDTSGLILFSRGGDLTQRLLHPRHAVEKEYVATVQHEVHVDKLKSALEEGVKTTEGVHTARLLHVSPFQGNLSTQRPPSALHDSLKVEDQHESTETELSIRPEENYNGPLTDIRLVVVEGKHRMVRRILANCGHPVVELRRERHGEVRLNDLGVGQFREPSEMEADWVEHLLSINSKLSLGQK